MKKVVFSALVVLLLAPMVFCANAEEKKELPVISFASTGETFELYSVESALGKTYNLYGYGKKPKSNFPQILVMFSQDWEDSDQDHHRGFCEPDDDERDARSYRIGGDKDFMLVVMDETSDPDTSTLVITRCGVPGKIQFTFTAKKKAFQQARNANKFTLWETEMVSLTWPEFVFEYPI